MQRRIRIMDYKLILSMMGGLGLFLYGMTLMSDGIEKAAGEKLRGILERLTTNRLTGMLVGIVFTGIIQSSSAATVMVVSFVNAGLMNLSQAAGVILGANIGTTVTSQLVSFNLSEIAPVFLLGGVIMVMFINNPTIKRYGEVVLGFGILFMGLTTMSGAMGTLKSSPFIMNTLSNLNNHFFGVLFGFACTAVLQSSSVTVSIVLLMASQGLLELPICFFIILGCNIGACVSAILACLGGNKNAKRAALIHFLFNVFGSILTFIVLTIALPQITSFFMMISHGDLGRCVANAHTIFKISQVIIFFPFMQFIISLTNIIVSGTDEETKVHHNELQFIGEHSVSTPTTAIPQAKQEINRLAEMAKDNLELSMEGFLDADDKNLPKIYKREEAINFISHAIINYLVKSNQMMLPVADRAILGSMFHVVNDIERIGDHAENFANFTRTEIKHNAALSDEAKEEIITMYSSVAELLNLAIKAFITDDAEKYFPKLNELENSIDKMERKYQKHHIKRMAKGICNPHAGLLFSDMLSALERIADHAMNIAFSINDDYESEDDEDEDETE